jgi:periplasmic copper chaperone A
MMVRRTAATVLGPVLTAVLIGAALAGCGGTATSDLGGGTPDLVVPAARASAPVAGASQLVLTIENIGDGADRLLGADTDAALAIEIHRTVVEPDGRAVMRMLDDVVLPAGETIMFRPGGLHLMVVVPDERVVLGGTFDVTLRFERSAPVTLSVAVVELLELLEDRGGAAGGD